MFFCPDGKISDNKFMPIYVSDLKKVLTIKGSSKKQYKFPDQHKQLESLTSNLDITDNPILMIVTLKRNFQQ